jgi:hypothetical protein
LGTRGKATDEEGNESKRAPGGREVVGIDMGVDGGIGVSQGGLIWEGIVLCVTEFAWFPGFWYDTERRRLERADELLEIMS